jgi:flagellar biosynthetic protein FliQ
MNADLVLGIARNAIEMTLLLSLPVLAIGLLVGLIISIFQAATQIQEMTLTFVPKILAMLLSILFLMPWMLTKMTEYTERLILNIPQYVK